MTNIYLDYAAATPVRSEVIDAMLPFFCDKFYNPSSIYIAGQDVKKSLESARKTIAQIIGSKPNEIIFTAGGTESDNLAVKGVMQKYPNSKVLVSAIEHEAVLRPASELINDIILVKNDGIVDLDRLKNQIDDSVVLVSVMYANNEVGTIQPIRQISQLIKNIRTDRQKRGIDLPLYFHTDACQAALYLDLHVSNLGVDMMTLNGGKMYGPKQSGILYANSHVKLKPQILGGGQERGYRSGTENVAAVVGFAKALEIAQSEKNDRIIQMKILQDIILKNLKKAFPRAVINGSLKNRLPNNIHVTFPGCDSERLLFELDENGIMAASGSACSASNDEPSHVLKAMNISDTDAHSSLRITMGNSTTEDQIIYVIYVLFKILKNSRKAS